jgi:hypothetical protein
LRRTFAILPESATRLTAEVDRWEGSLNLLRLAFDRESSLLPSKKVVQR